MTRVAQRYVILKHLAQEHGFNAFPCRKLIRTLCMLSDLNMSGFLFSLASSWVNEYLYRASI